MLFVRGKLIDPDQPPSGDNDGGGGSGSESGGDSGSGSDSGSELTDLYVHINSWETTINDDERTDHVINCTIFNNTDHDIIDTAEFSNIGTTLSSKEVNINAGSNTTVEFTILDRGFIDGAITLVNENVIAYVENWSGKTDFNFTQIPNQGTEDDEPTEPVEPISFAREKIAIPSGTYGNFDRASILELYDDTTGDSTYHVISEKSHYLLDVLSNKLTLLDTNDDYFTIHLNVEDTNRCHVAIGNKIYWAYQDYGGYVSIRSWDAENGINTSFMPASVEGLKYISGICTDGTYIYTYSHSTKTLYKIDVDTKEVTGLITSELTIHQMVYSQFSECIYYYCSDGKLYEYRLSNNEITELCDIPSFLGGVGRIGVFAYNDSIYLMGGDGSGEDAVIEQYVRRYSISDNTIEIIKTDAPKAHSRLYFIPSSDNILYSIGNDDNKGLYFEGVLN